MTKYGVTAAGIVGIGVALWLIVHYSSASRASEDRPEPDSPVGERLAWSTGRVAGMIAAAFVASGLVLGLGGRLLMRVVASTSSSAAQGRVTDADEVVGDVTIGGSVSLVIFATFAGLVGLLIYVLLRRWLPDRSLLAGLATACIGAGLLARPSGLLEPDNEDFVILSPTWLAVLLVMALMLLFGLLLAVLADSWAQSWPRPAASLKGIAGLVPLLLTIPLVIGAVITAMAIAYTTFVTPLAARTTRLRAVDAVGVWVVGALAVVGASWTFLAAGEILTI